MTLIKPVVTFYDPSKPSEKPAEALDLEAMGERSKAARKAAGIPDPIITVNDPAFHRPSYEQGYREGESSMHADYTFALDEIEGFEWPEDRDFYPTDVVAVIKSLVDRIDTLAKKIDEGAA